MNLILIITGLLFLPWFSILLAQLHELEVTSYYRTLYGLPSLSFGKQLYNIIAALLSQIVKLLSRGIKRDSSKH